MAFFQVIQKVSVKKEGDEDFLKIPISKDTLHDAIKTEDNLKTYLEKEKKDKIVVFLFRSGKDNVKKVKAVLISDVTY